MELLIVGKPNVGKTLLLINFAAYLGVKELRIDVDDGEGVARRENLSLERARRDLVSLASPKTQGLQTVVLEPAIARQRAALVVLDTCGIAEGISEQAQERQQVALTLERIFRADLILHVVDASATTLRRIETPGPFDFALAEYGRMHTRYFLAANKMDRPGSSDGYRLLKERFRGLSVTPISAMTRRGFREVKYWLFRAVL